MHSQSQQLKSSYTEYAKAHDKHVLPVFGIWNISKTKTTGSHRNLKEIFFGVTKKTLFKSFIIKKYYAMLVHN